MCISVTRGGGKIGKEQEKSLEALKTGIKMEIDGKEYYIKASQSSRNKFGEILFANLAKEEDDHRRKFEEIYKSIQIKNRWPQIELKSHFRSEFNTLFAKALTNINPISSELEAVETAMTMENKTRDFYRTCSSQSSFKNEKIYFEKLAEEEGTHYIALLDYYEYLKNPSGWFTLKEHHSMDGG